MDAWVAERTQGLLKHMPVSASSATLLVPASAISVRTPGRSRSRTCPGRSTPVRGPGNGGSRGFRVRVSTSTGLRGAEPDRATHVPGHDWLG